MPVKIVGNAKRHRSIGLFGVPFDPLPSPDALIIKQKYVIAQALGNITTNNYLSPYDVFSNDLPESINIKCNLHGELSIPTWLRPKPKLSDAGKLTIGNLNSFVQRGGCMTIANKVRDFVSNSVLPEIPGMIGIDHSSTYGVIAALKDYYKMEKIGLIVLDSHFDAVPMALRYGIMDYAKEMKLPSITTGISSQSRLPDFSPDEIRKWSKLNAENFIYYLLKHKMIEPQNLIVVGLTDYPDKTFRGIEDPRVKDYIDFFESLEKDGCCFIPKSDLDKNGLTLIKKALNSLDTRLIYISFDIDIGSITSVYACRFLNTIGLPFNEIQEVIKVLFDRFSKDLILAGFDVMEIDIHKLGMKIDNSHMDHTGEIFKLLMESIAGII